MGNLLLRLFLHFLLDNILIRFGLGERKGSIVLLDDMFKGGTDIGFPLKFRGFLVEFREFLRFLINLVMGHPGQLSKMLLVLRASFGFPD